MIIKVFYEYVDDVIHDMAQSHIEGWAERYTGKSKEDIEYDLNVNYDISSESENIEELLKDKFNDDGFELNQEEKDYVEESFIEAVLDSF